MRQQRLLSALCFACGVLTASSSWAATTATVLPSQGAVMINSVNGFRQIKKPVKLKVGGSVMVAPDGLAMIAYADGCQVDVKPGAVTTIAPLSPCASGASADTSYSFWQNQTVGGDFALLGVAGVFAGIIWISVSP
jgi:hypothetical protein